MFATSLGGVALFASKFPHPVLGPRGVTAAAANQLRGSGPGGQSEVRSRGTFADLCLARAPSVSAPAQRFHILRDIKQRELKRDSTASRFNGECKIL